jgi:hypothetical protein
MSVANCNIVCREIEEADRGQNLNAPVMEHLGGCGACRRFYDERLKLRQLVGSLETVAAPADFELRVRSRIANERRGMREGFWFNNFTLGIPSAALASLVLVVGVVFTLKVWNTPTNNTAIHSEAPKVTGTSVQSTPPSAVSTVKPVSDKGVLANLTGGAADSTHRDRVPKKRSQVNGVALLKNGGRSATREFSSTPAPVIKKEEAIASSSPVFSIETSAQPMRLSLDYSGGVSRTISVSALSFGSEGVLIGGSSPLVKTSAKGAW